MQTGNVKLDVLLRTDKRSRETMKAHIKTVDEDAIEIFSMQLGRHAPKRGEMALKTAGNALSRSHL